MLCTQAFLHWINWLTNYNIPQNSQPPVWTHIRRLTKAPECLSVHNAILEKEMKEVKGVLSKQKEHQKGKRNICLCLLQWIIIETLLLRGRNPNKRRQWVWKSKVGDLKRSQRLRMILYRRWSCNWRMWHGRLYSRKNAFVTNLIKINVSLPGDPT